MKLSYKLILGYLLVALLGSVTTYFALRSYQNINGSFDELMNEPVPMIKSLEDIQASGFRIISSTSEICFILSQSGTPDGNILVEEKHQLIHSGIEKYHESLKHYENLVNADDTADIKFLDAIKKNGDALVRTSEQIIATTGKDIREKEILEEKELFEVQEIAFLLAIDTALEVEHKELAEGQVKVEATIAQATFSTSLVTFFTFILAIISGLYISHHISSRITKLKKASEEVGRGELETIIEIEANDEIGALTRSFNKMVRDLKESGAARKKIENALRHNEEKYRELIENANDVIYTLDVSGTKYTSLNKAGEQITGYTRAEALHLGIADVVSEEDLERVLQQTAKKLSGEGQTNFELEIITKNGSLVMLDISSRLIYQDGVVAGIQGIGRDITERKRVEMERQAITEIVESVITASNLDELFTLAYQAINRCISAENCYIALYNPVTELLHYELWEDKVRPVPAPHPIEKSFGGYVLKSRQPVLLNKEFEEQMYQSGMVDRSNGYSPSWMGVPLRIGKKTIGILVVQDYEKCEVYSARDLEMLSAVGDQLALAIARKRNEIELKASEEQHRLLFDGNPQPAYVYDLETLAFLTVNEAAVHHYGYSREEFLTGITVKDIRPPEDIPGFLETVSGITPESVTIFAPSKHQKKDGTVIDVEITATPLMYSGRHAVIVLANDVTERKRAEAEQARLYVQLESQRKRLNDIIGNVKGVVWETMINKDDAPNRFDFVSDYIVTMLGYSVKTFLSTPNFWLSIIHPEDKGRVMREVLEIFNNRRSGTIDFRWVRKDGRVIWIESRNEVICNDEGERIGLRGVTMDITERKKAEEQLEIFNQKLQQSNRELQDFAYVASHDLQEPLRKVQAFADRLNSKYAKALTGEGLDYLERMRSAANRMQTLIQDLLTFSRVTTKGQPFLAVNLETVTREVLSDLEISIEIAGAKIEMDNLPEVDADPMQMRQLIQNLIGNAIKFRRKDIAPIIKISAQSVESNSNGNGNGSNGNLCQLTVEDNGIGFDEKYLDRIFTVFQRLHGRTEYEGSGVGLAVCRKIAERHHGSITAQSSVDKGTTFIVTLPFKQPKTEIN
jgi:PAS domain S-box-containing protein